MKQEVYSPTDHINRIKKKVCTEKKNKSQREKKKKAEDPTTGLHKKTRKCSATKTLLMASTFLSFP
jgi:hypothetical protein